MGLATTDPYCRKVHTEIHKIPKFGVYQTRYNDLKTSKFTKKCMAIISGALSDSVRMAIHFFVHFDIFKWLYLFYYWVYLHQTWGFCKTWSTLYDHVDQ